MSTNPPPFLTRLALALALLRAHSPRSFLRFARHLQTQADGLRVARLLAALREPAEATEDEVTAARRRAYLLQHHQLGS